jgi:hypothetical protein
MYGPTDEEAAIIALMRECTDRKARPAERKLDADGWTSLPGAMGGHTVSASEIQRNVATRRLVSWNRT